MHDLDLTSGQAAIAWSGDVPWHGLGQRLTADASLETWTREAGLEYDIQARRVGYFPNANQETGELGEPTLIPNLVSLIRSDTKAHLATASERYKIVQPKAVMEFFRDLTSQNKLKMECAGALRSGAIYWALARMDDAFNLSKDDVILPYVLLATSCDGSRATTASFTSVRVVCWNTLSHAMNERGTAANTRVRVPHNSVFDEQKVKTDMGLLDGSWQDFQKKAQQLSKAKVTQAEVTEFMVNLLTKTNKSKQNDPTGMNADEISERLKAMPTVIKALDIYENGVGQQTKSAKGTAWGMVNAISRIYDHETKAITQSSRLHSTWFGAGARTKRAALQAAMEFVK